MDEFSLTVDYFASDNINFRRRAVPDSPTKFHTVPSITISKLQNCHQIEQPSPPLLSSSTRNLRQRSDSETSDESIGDVDAFQYFIEHNDETLLLPEIEDEDDDESPLLSQIVPTDETVKEEQELKELEDKINSEESLPSSSSSLSLASPCSSSSLTSDSSSNPTPSTTTIVSNNRKRPHSSIDSTPITVAKKPKVVVSQQKTEETPPVSQSSSQAVTTTLSTSGPSSQGGGGGGQAFRDIFNSLQNQVQRAPVTSSPSRTSKPVFIRVTRITVILPIKSIASLKTLEKRVAEDVRVKQALHERLSRVSGTNALDCIERVLNTFVTPEVRRKMDWIATPGKFCFGSTILQPITFDSVRFHFPQATDSQLEQFTRNWFMQGNSISM